MRYASVCSGVGSDHLAFSPLGWECAWFSEIDPFASALLAHRFPDVPNVGDMTSISDEEINRRGPIDLLVGGTPCQGFSVAGRGKGLDDPRSQLALAFVDLARRIAPRWIVWENVGGVRNSKHAADLCAFIEAFQAIGYLGCFRSLDARYFGLAQRRDRVFAVFHTRDWRPPAAVLFEPDCVRRDSPKGGEARARTAAAVTRGLGSGGADDNKAQAGHLVASTLKGYSGRNQVEATYVTEPLARCVTTREGLRHDETAETLIVHPTLRGHNRPASNPADGSVVFIPDLADPVCANEARTSSHAVNNPRVRNVVAFNSHHHGQDAGELSPTLRSAAGVHANGGVPPAVADEIHVRRLTPIECERLMGLPDDWTLVPYRRGKPAKDGPRYKAIGNGIAIPVLTWVGERIDKVDRLLTRPASAT